MFFLDLLFVALVMFYVIVAMKIDEWSALVALGFESETPQGFTDLPWIYALMRSGIFLIAMLLLLVTVYIPWQLGLAALAVAWIVSDRLGRRKAFNNVREICRETIAYAENDEERAEREAWSKKKDWEFEEMIRAARRR
jgi:hypothetical protein